MHATLGVSPLAYLPFAFLNLLVPLITIGYGYAGITMARAEGSADPEGEAGYGTVRETGEHHEK